MSGVGKTMLAAAVVHDQEIRQGFFDGIVWLTFGQTPDVLNLQRRLLTWVASRAGPPTDVSAGRDMLDSALKSGRWLIVLDDVWRPDDLRGFDVADTPSRLLITTRDEAIVRASGAWPHVVEELTTPAARAFLAEAVGLAEPDLPSAAADVIRECGRLPLALAMAGATLAEAPRDEALWRDVVAALGEADHEQLRKEFDYLYPHAMAAIQASVDFLPPDDREAYLQLAIFSEDVPIPFEPLEKLWGVTGLTLRNRIKLFVDRALARRQDERTIFVHDLQGDFVRKRCPDPQAAHMVLLDRYREGSPTGWADLAHDGYVHGHLLRHLNAAGRSDEICALLLDWQWLAQRLKAVGTIGLCAAYDQHSSNEMMRLVGDAIRMSLHALERDPGQLVGQLFGRVAEVRGYGLPGPLFFELPVVLIGALAETQGSFMMPRRASLLHPGPLRQTLNAHHGPITALTITVDGKQATLRSHDSPVKVWNLEDGQMLEEVFESIPESPRDQPLKFPDLLQEVQDILPGQTDNVTAVAGSPDGSNAGLGYSDGMLKIWNFRHGASPRTLAGHGSRISSVAMTPNARYVISGDSNGMLKLWDLDRDDLSPQVKGHADLVYAVAVTPDGKRGISSSRDRTLKLWDIEAGCVEATFRDQGSAATSVGITPDGERAICGSLDGTLSVWNLRTAALEAAFVGHGGEVSAVAITPEGARAISACGSEVKAWDIASEECIISSNNDWVGAVAIAPDGGRAYIGVYNDWGGAAKVKVWDLSANQLVRHVSGVHHVSAVSVTPGGKWASLRSDRSPTLEVWCLDTYQLLAELYDGEDEVRAIAVTPDGKYAISGSDTGMVQIHEVATLRRHASFQTDGGVTALAAAKYGVVVVGDSSGAIHILHCLTAFPKPEARELLDAIDRNIRGQISTIGRYQIASRKAGSICRVDDASCDRLIYMMAFNVCYCSRQVGIVVVEGALRRVCHNIQAFSIASVECRYEDPDGGWYGDWSWVRYRIRHDNDFEINVSGHNELNLPLDMRTERYVQEYQITLHEPAKIWGSGGSRGSVHLRGVVTSKNNWRSFVKILEKEWVQMDVCGPSPWD